MTLGLVAVRPVNILLHTIALEPARWTPQRVLRPLLEILPAIARAGFYKLEIFEPHLTLAADESALRAELAALHLVPLVLSSYLDLTPGAVTEAAYEEQSRALLDRVDFFGFRKVRLFPGRRIPAGTEAETEAIVAARLMQLADERPRVDFLIETHNDSLADDPAAMVRLMERCARPNLGLIWQPTVFKPDLARAQLALQRDWVRHFHLQNRDARDQFVRLGSGVIPWGELLAMMPARTDVTVEFVPSAICAPGDFNLAASVQEAVEEFGCIAKITG